MSRTISTIATLVALVVAAFALSTGAALAEPGPSMDAATESAGVENAPPDIALPEAPDPDASDTEPPAPPAPDDEVAPDPCAEPDACPPADPAPTPAPTPAPGPDDLAAPACPTHGCGAVPSPKPGKGGSSSGTTEAKPVVATQVPVAPRLDVPVPTRIDAGGMPQTTRVLLLVAAGILVATSALAAWMSRPGVGSGARR